jgi:hypothetical protein
VAAAQQVLRAVRKKSCSTSVAMLCMSKESLYMYASVNEVSRSSPIRECKLLFSNLKTEKDLSAVAVETGKVANIVSSLRMFGKQSALQTSSDDSESPGLSFKAPQANCQDSNSISTSSIVPSR